MSLTRDPFVVVGMSHNLSSLPKILSVCKKEFKAKDNVMIELPQSVIDSFSLMHRLINGETLTNKECVKLRQEYLLSLFWKEMQSSLRQIADPSNPKKALTHFERRDLKDSLNSTTAFKLIVGLREAKIIPVGGVSIFRFMAGKKLLRSNLFVIPISEKYILKRLIFGAKTKQIVGALYGSSHAKAISSGLREQGIITKITYAERPLFKLVRKIKTPYYNYLRKKLKNKKRK